MRKPAFSSPRVTLTFRIANPDLTPSSSVIVCAGGLGTFEELSEFLCQRQLGLHHKPIALLNTRGFFDALLQQFKHMVAEGFLPAAHVECLIVENDVTVLLDKVLPPPRALFLHHESKACGFQTK